VAPRTTGPRRSPRAERGAARPGPAPAARAGALRGLRRHRRPRAAERARLPGPRLHALAGHDGAPGVGERASGSDGPRRGAPHPDLALPGRLPGVLRRRHAGRPRGRRGRGLLGPRRRRARADACNPSLSGGERSCTGLTRRGAARRGGSSRT
jgi:hypothetical protein